MRCASFLPTFLLATFSSLGATPPKEEAPAESAAARAPENAAAVKFVRELLQNNPRLTTEDGKAPQHFHFRLRVTLPLKEGGTNSMEYLVDRDGNRVSVLMLSEKGLPYGYTANKLLLVLRGGSPGELLVHEGGSPHFVLKVPEETGELKFDMSYQTGPVGPVAALDLGSILRATLEKLQWAELNGDEVRLRTDRSVVTVSVPKRGERSFPVKSLVMSGQSGVRVEVSDIKTEEKARPATHEVSRDSVRKLGISTRPFNREDAGRPLLIVPPGFGSDPKEVEAAEKLRRLVPLPTGGKPTTRTLEF